MAKGKKRRQAKPGMTVSLAVIAGLLPLANQAIQGFREGGIKRVGDRVCSSLTGYDPAVGRWEAAYLKNGLLPILLGVGVHKLAGKVGVNRAIANAGIPFLRV